MSDSLMLEATGESAERLSEILRLCSSWRDEEPSWASWKKVDSAIVFCRFPTSGEAFPNEVDHMQASTFAIKHLEKLSREHWPPQPDIDGDIHEGWKVLHDWNGTRVEPFWMIYHK